MLARDLFKEDKLKKWVEKNVFSQLCTEEKIDPLKDYMKVKKIVISLWKPKLQIFEERDFRVNGYLSMDYLKDLKGIEVGKTTIVSTEPWFSEEELIIKLVATKQLEETKGKGIKVWQGLDEDGNDIYSEEKEEDTEEIKESDLF